MLSTKGGVRGEMPAAPGPPAPAPARSRATSCRLDAKLAAVVAPSQGDSTRPPAASRGGGRDGAGSSTPRCGPLSSWGLGANSCHSGTAFSPQSVGVSPDRTPRPSGWTLNIETLGAVQPSNP